MEQCTGTSWYFGIRYITVGRFLVINITIRDRYFCSRKSLSWPRACRNSCTLYRLFVYTAADITAATSQHLDRSYTMCRFAKNAIRNRCTINSIKKCANGSAGKGCSMVKDPQTDRFAFDCRTAENILYTSFIHRKCVAMDANRSTRISARRFN